MVLFPSSLCHCLWIPPLYMQERGLLLFCLRLPNDSVSARETINRTRYWKDEWNRYLIVMYNICAWRSPRSFPWKFFLSEKTFTVSHVTSCTRNRAAFYNTPQQGPCQWRQILKVLHFHFHFQQQLVFMFDFVVFQQLKIVFYEWGSLNYVVLAIQFDLYILFEDIMSDFAAQRSKRVKVTVKIIGN